MLLLALLVVAVQASAFTQWQRSKSIRFFNSHAQHELQGSNATHVAAIFPFESVPAGLEIEILEEAEIEDDLDECWTNIVNAIFSDEAFYTSSERSRYLQHHALLHNRQTVPYFILYHSWKSYLA